MSLASVKVLKGGRILYRGLIWHHPNLEELVGQTVLAMRDTSCRECFCTVFTEDNEFLCGAKNKKRWQKLIQETGG